MERTNIRLGVNIDHVATVRQARRAVEPDPVTAAALAILGGADNITLHLREDRRHIQDRDLRLMREMVPQRLNLEMAAAEAIVDIACAVKPDQVTLVPERREELTTEGGLDLTANQQAVTKALARLTKSGIEVAVFLDPDEHQIEIARMLGFRAVELQTARYSEAKTPADHKRELDALRDAAELLHSRHMAIHMGHGLTYWNVRCIAHIPNVEELNIGHSIVSRAVFVGMERAVREMKDAIRTA
jgi:pyridoxine 5-phosphate synthase